MAELGALPRHPPRRRSSAPSFSSSRPSSISSPSHPSASTRPRPSTSPAPSSSPPSPARCSANGSGPRRWAAIVVGFIGVLVVIRPGTSAFEPAMLFSGRLDAVQFLLHPPHPRLSPRPTRSSMLLDVGLAASLMLAPVALPVFGVRRPRRAAAMWSRPVACGAVGHWMLIHAYRLAPAPILAPFTYSQLIWMIGAGYLFFADVPDRHARRRRHHRRQRSLHPLSRARPPRPLRDTQGRCKSDGRTSSICAASTISRSGQASRKNRLSRNTVRTTSMRTCRRCSSCQIRKSGKKRGTVRR